MEYAKNYSSYLESIGYHYTTIQNKIKHLSTYLEYTKTLSLEILEVKSTHIIAYYHYLKQIKVACRIVTYSQYMVTLRQFYHWLMELGYLEYHPFGNFKLEKDPIKKQRIPILEAKIKQLYKSTESPPEKLLLIFGYGCALRAKEMLQLQVRDINYDKALLVVRNGKNNKRRVVPLQPLHLQYLRHYVLQEGLSKYSHFINVSHSTLLIYFKNMQKRLDWLPPYYSLHHLRHSIASHLVDRGLKIELVQHFLGHSSLQTTQVYITPINKVELWKNA